MYCLQNDKDRKHTQDDSTYLEFGNGDKGGHMYGNRCQDLQMYCLRDNEDRNDSCHRAHSCNR